MKRSTRKKEILTIRPNEKLWWILQQLGFLDRHRRARPEMNVNEALVAALVAHFQSVPRRGTENPTLRDLANRWQEVQIRDRQARMAELQREIAFLASPWPETLPRPRALTEDEIRGEVAKRREMEFPEIPIPLLAITSLRAPP